MYFKKHILLMVIIASTAGCGELDKKRQTSSDPSLRDKNPLLSEFKTPFQTIPFDEIKLEHYLPAYETALEEGREDISLIINNIDPPTFENTIESLENSGKNINRINGILFNLDGADTNDSLQEIVETITPLLTNYSNDIMLNEELFKRVKVVYESTDRSSLSTEGLKLLDNTYYSFVRNGANLSPKDKIEYREITEKLSNLSIKFSRNILEETNKYELILTDEKELDGLPSNTKEAAQILAKQKKKKGWLFNLSAPSYLPFMQYANNRNLRKQLYLAYTNKACKGDSLDNQENVKQITALRLKKAQLLGYNTYADFVLEKTMAGKTTEVFTLLDNLKAAFKPIAKEEYDEVKQFAISNGLEDGNLQAWDWTYYTNKLKQDKYAYSEEDTKPYFELESVKLGVFGLATKLYGITFKKNENIQTYNSEVEAFEVIDKDGSYLGVLYTDFHPRSSKRGGAWMTNFTDQERGVRPHISIVMNFTRATENTPALLTFREVETFLHEFGHALHGLFANTEYASLSGTSVYRDFVELPSQVMENWASEKDFLDGFAKNYKTGDSIPAALVNKIKKSENYLVGNNCLRQLNFGYLDMAWHTLKTPYSGSVINFDKEAVADTQLLPDVDDTSISTQFSHIFAGGYAAGYYSYKWAEVLDADAYSLFQKQGIFNTSTAQSFRKNILEQGGTENPMVLYKKFRGKEPKIDALLERSGIPKKQQY